MYALKKYVPAVETATFGISLFFLLMVTSYCYCDNIVDATIATLTTLFFLIASHYVNPILTKSFLGHLALCIFVLMCISSTLVVFPLIIKQNDWYYCGIIILIFVSLIYIIWYISILNWQQIVGEVALGCLILAIRIAFIADIQNRFIYSIVFMLIGISMSNETTHNSLTFLITCALRSIGLKR